MANKRLEQPWWIRVAGKLKHTFGKAGMLARIGAKWAIDSLRLPLTSKHRRVYAYVHNLQKRATGRFPDLINLPTYNDKIAWLQLFDQSLSQVECVDKILVRDYVQNRRQGVGLVPLLAVADRLDEIDFDALPNSYVVKTNHDSGGVYLVKDSSRLDRGELEAFVDKHLANTYGVRNGECAYSLVKPRVFVEEYLDPTADSPPPDFKIHCAGGEPKFIQYIFDRGVDAKEAIYTSEWERMPLNLDQNFGHHFGEIAKPDCLDEMLRISRELSADFRYVRVDLYDRGGRVLFGELTFYPLVGCYTTPGLGELGGLLDFDTDSPAEFPYAWDPGKKVWVDGGAA